MRAAESSHLSFTVLVVSMLRGAFANTTARFAGGAAVAAAASPDVSHAYARPLRSVLPGEDKQHKDQESRSSMQDLESLRTLNASWLLANVENGKVYVEAADVEDALSEVFEYGGKLHRQTLSDDDDASSCTSGASADAHIERADSFQIRQCGSLLTTLLNNPGVQQSVHQALQQDPNFARFLENTQGPSNLLPPPPAEIEIEDVTDTPEEPGGVINPFHSAMDKLGDGLVKLGEGVSSAGGHLGGLFVGLGNKLRGTILGAHAQTKKAVQEPGSHKDFWMNALGVLAVAVLSILFAKGKLKVRTA